MAEDQDADRAWAAAATRELLRAIGLYRKDPGYASDALGLLTGTYRDAVDAGLTPERIERLTGMSIAELEDIVGAP
jgi:hypothetical protein